VQNYSSQVSESLSCLEENPSTKKITQLKWPKKLNYFAKMISSAAVQQEQVQKWVNKAHPDNAIEMPV